MNQCLNISLSPLCLHIHILLSFLQKFNTEAYRRDWDMEGFLGEAGCMTIHFSQERENGIEEVHLGGWHAVLK